MNKPKSHGFQNLRQCVQAALAFLFTSTGLLAAPYFGEAFTYRQPDGETFQVHLYGDEFFAYQETVDGYLVVHDPNNGLFCYAKVTPDGSDIISTGVRVGQAKPAGIKSKQRLGPDMAMKKSLGNRNLLGVDERGRRNPGKKLKAGKGREILNVPIVEVSPQAAPADASITGTDPIALPAPPAGPTLNQRVGLVLLASFPDLPGDVTKTVADIDDYCNAEVYTAGGNATSVYGYFKIQSNGKLSYKNNVTAWFTAANPRSYYTDTGVAYGTRARELINEGLAVLKARGFDFKQCDANNDNRLDGVNCFYAGGSVNAWNAGLWPHQSGSSWSGLSGTGISKTDFEYQITDMPSNLTIGTFCHENGHMICDFPDLYSYYGCAAEIGAYSLMASSGSTHPRHVDAYLKIHAGWADVVDLTSASQQLCAVQQDRNFFYRYKNPAKPTEYFIFEVRGNAGYEGAWNGTGAVNPANGLVIYHALQTGRNPTSTIFTADNPTANYATPYELMVVEALPSATVTPWYDDPNPGSNDAFTASGVSSISDSTTPNLKFWAANGRTVASGANINTVSAPGATMTFVIGSGPLPATPVTNVTATQLQPNVDFGKTAANQTFSVFNGGGGTLSYNISDDAAWLTCAPVSGTATTEADLITVSYTTAALAAGTHTATITIDGGSAGIKTIGVTLTVNQQPTLAVSASSFAMIGVAGSLGPSASFNVSNTGGGTAAYTITKTQPWLTLGRTSGTVAIEVDLIDVSLDATSLAKGVYYDTITITSAEATNSPLTIPVTFTVDGADMILTDPNGGETWRRTTTQTITWASGIGGNVKIELFKNGVFNSTISASTPNDGSHAWLIPAGQALGSNYRIRITHVDTPTALDESMADFSIALAPIYYASMDTNPGWTLGTSWAYGQPTGAGQDAYGGPDPSSGQNGTNAIGYRLDGDYEASITSTRWATMPVINCSGRQNIQLSFQRWLGIESFTNDKAYIQVSNNGTAWTQVWANPTSVTNDTAWTYCQYDISAVAANKATVYIRWGLGTTNASSNGSGWNLDEVTVNGDLIGAGYEAVITQSGGTTDVIEGGSTDTYSLRLTSAPTADVTVNITPDSQVGVSPNSLTFTTANWDTDQTVTVTAVDDSLNEFAHSGVINHSATSADANYNAIGIDGFLVSITDNDNIAPVANAGPDQTVYLVGDVWSPLALAPQLWLDADDAATVTLNGSTVSSWQDKSGFNRHATQPTPTSQPTATAAGLNGKRVVTFDGASDVLNVDLDFLAGVSHSTFIVTKPTAYNNIYGAANGSAGANSLHVGFASAANYRMNYWGNDFGPGLSVNFHTGSGNILNYVWTSGATKQIYANGSSEGSTTGAGVIGTMSGGGRIGSTTGQGFYGGMIAEFISVTGAVSLANRQSLEGYLAHKWGLAGWLPAAHPYKTQSPTNASAVVYLDGSVSDANGDSLTTTWSLVTGPAPVSFDNVHAVDPVATFTVAGVYTLSLSVSDSASTSSAEVVITINPALAGYTVTYVGNNSTGGTVPVDANNPHTDGTTVTVLGNTGSLVRAGYTFNHWNTAANGSGTSYATDATFTITGHTTLYAQWIPNTYTVTLDQQSGSGGSASAFATFGTAMPTAIAPTRTGYTFGGYYTQVSGGGVQYYNAAMASSRNWDMASNTTLYAKWSANTYTVTFDPQSGSGGSDSVTAIYGSAMPAAIAPTLTGYTFGGYYSEVSGGGTQYYDATMASVANWDLLANTTLYAKWTVNTYDVAFDSNGGAVADPVSKQVTYESTYGTLPSTSRLGYDFNGWFTAASGGTEVTAATVVTAVNNHTLYAQWTAHTYVVSYLGNGNTSGTAPGDHVKVHDVDLTLATNTGSMNVIDFSFAGWNTAADGSGTAYGAGAIYADNAPLTLYAQWTPGADGTWSQTTAGPFDWSTSGNWSGGTVASGADRTANFTPNITAAQVVNLNTARTIGNITFTDSTTASHDLTISGANTLTLVRTSGMPVINVTNRTLTISSQISGSNGLSKSGAGTLALNGNNTFTGDVSVTGGILALGNNNAFGDIIINGGTLTMNATSLGTGILGVAGGNLIFSGTSAFNPQRSNTGAYNKNVAINGGTTTFNMSTQYYHETFSGVLSGDGTIAKNDGNGILTFSNASNTFTGTIILNAGVGGIVVNSLADSTNPIQFNGNTGAFKLGSGTASPLVFNSRQIELLGTTSGGRIENANASTSNTIIINTGLKVTGVGNKTVTLGGTNTGNNAFNGAIANAPGSVISVTKADAGTWALGGTNTYSGVTNLAASGTTGRLVFQGSQSLSPNTKLVLAQASSNVQSVRFLDDGTGTLNFARPIEFGGGNTTQSLNLFVGNNNTANLGSGSGITTGSTIQLGDITFTSTAADTNTTTLNATGANGYRLQTGTITLNNLVTRTAGSTTVTALNPTTANMTVAAITMAAGNTGIVNDGVPVLRLTGTSADNLVTGAISNASDYLTGQALSCEKQGTGTWTLSGANSYTGTTTVSAGKLFINGDQSLATGNVTVAAAATLGGTGIIGGNTTIAATGKLEFDLSTNAAGHNKLELAAGKTLTFSGASVLTITSSGGAQIGTYTLFTAPGGISGVAPATLNLPASWAATVSIVGNDLVLNVTSVGSIVVDHFAISAISSPQTVGTPITGITLTAQNASNQTATSFTGTVTFGGTAGITGTSASFVNGVLSGLSVTPTVAGIGLTLTVNDGAAHTGSTVFTVRSVFDSWASVSGLSGGEAIIGANPDGDSLTNLQEFAFGMNPNLSVLQPLVFAMDGNVTTPGVPVMMNFSSSAVPDYRAVFARRKDRLSAGLVYAVEFSADMVLWTASATSPTVLTNVSSVGEMEAVSVPYPATTPVTGGGNAAPKFFRVTVE